MVLLQTGAAAQGFLRTDQGRIVNDKGEPVLWRGMGLGGWMLQEGYMLKVQGIGNQQHVIKAKISELVGPDRTEEFYQSWRANHMRKIDVDSLAAWGFNSVRLPMHYNLFTLPVESEPVQGQDTWRNEGFEMVDQLLAWCKANKVYLILDLHAAPGGQGNDVNIADRDETKLSLWESELNQKKTIALWKKLAERYANEPWIGAYDLINEPNWGFESKDDSHGCGEKKNEPLQALFKSITAAIREVDKNHIIIIEGNCWGNNYGGITPDWDSNLVMSFHKYWNYNDAGSIAGIMGLRDKYHVPVWLGESGENSNVWFRDAIHLMEANQIGWCWWPLKKLGFNNPLEVRVPGDYSKVLDYWAGKGAKPTQEIAWNGLKELAENLRLENCIYHRDVIDAMFRQVQTSKTIPYKTNVLNGKITIPAVEFDLGRNGKAYYDLDTADYHISAGGDWKVWNSGRVFRNDGVDIGQAGNDYYVTRFEPREWLQYSIRVPEGAGAFAMQIEAASATGAKIIISSPTFSVTGVIPKSGSHNWKSVSLPAIRFDRGDQQVRVTVKEGTIELKSLTFEAKR